MLPLTLTAAAFLVPLAVTAWLVDDWSRDLTTNRASTRTDAKDPLMRPITRRLTIGELDAAINALCEASPRWSRADGAAAPPADAGLPAAGEAVVTRRLVRTTPLMRFKDDVWLVATPAAPAGVEHAGERQLSLHLHSRSRVGRGDLGQNPRNLRQLNRELLARLEVDPTARERPE